MSPRDGPALASLLCLVTGWEQPMESVAKARMQGWVSEHNSWGLHQLPSLRVGFCEAHSYGGHKC